MDADHANALDKSVAGDTLLGTVTIGSGAEIVSNTLGGIQPLIADAIISGVLHGIKSIATGGIYTTHSAGIRSEVANGIVTTVAGGISDGGVAGGIAASVARGISDGGVAGGIAPSVAGGITDGGVVAGINVLATGGLSSQASAGGIALNGGIGDWVTYGTTRTTYRNIMLAPAFGSASPYSPGTGWTMAFATGPMLVGGATTNSYLVPLNEFFHGGVNGATLTGATLVFAVIGPHANLPGALPFLDILRIPVFAGNSPSTTTSMYTGGLQGMGTTTGTWTAPANHTAWDASGNFQNFVTTPNAVGVRQIDLLNYVYYARIQDESGANSVPGNLYLSLLLTFSAIGNSAPG